MDSSNTDDKTKGAVALSQIELTSNSGSHISPLGPPYPSCPPSMHTTVPAPGSAYPAHHSIQVPSSTYLPDYHNPIVSAAYPPAYGCPPAAYPMVGCPYPPVSTPVMPFSGITTKTTPANQSLAGASYATQFPYSPPQNLADPTAYLPFQNLAYPPQNMSHHYPQQIPNQIGLVPPSIGMAADPRHYQGAPAKLVELGNPTVRPASNFDSQTDAEKLRDSLKLSSPNKDVLINILCHRSLEQRLIIANKYNELTGESLVNEIKTKFDCNFQKIMLALITPLIDFYVMEFNEALEDYDFDSLIDIMCLLSNYEMYTLKYVYEKKYGIPLETKLESKTSVHLKRLLLAICVCNRDETGITNLAAAQYDAGQLALQEDPYDHEKCFYYDNIFATRSFQQIKLISEEYQKTTGESLEKAIKNKFIIDDKQGYLCIVRYSQNKYGFFAKRLHRSMAGMGTNDNQLIRLIVTRCEIDLQDIKNAFQRNFGKSLRSWIKGDTSGHYKYCLYELIGEKRSN